MRLLDIRSINFSRSNSIDEFGFSWIQKNKSMYVWSIQYGLDVLVRVRYQGGRNEN